MNKLKIFGAPQLLKNHDFLKIEKNPLSGRDRPTSKVFKHLSKMPEKILETYFVPALADISIKGSRKGQKGQEKINQMKQKFSVRFENFLEEYESIFTECGIEIMETRLFASEIEQQKRLPEDNLRKAIVRFRKVYLYISEKELSAEKCGERLMKKYRANVSTIKDINK